MGNSDEDRAAGDTEELTYQDRSIRSWVEALSDGDDCASRRASEALARMGKEIAACLPALGSSLPRQTGDDRAQSATELGLLGARLLAVLPRFRAALRALILTDGDATVRTCALHALQMLEPGGATRIPALIEALRDELPTVRAGAAQDLAQLGHDIDQQIPELVPACLRDPDIAVRVHAAVALWRVNRKLYPTLPVLIEGLRSGDPILCWTAADCLGDIGPDAAEAVPALLDAFAQKQRPLISTSIALALERIDPQAAATLDFS